LVAFNRSRRRTSAVGICLVIASAVVSALTLTGCGGPSSAFSASKLASAASKEWLTNGGSLTNDRYSSLDQITSSNVSQLKGIWHIHLHSGTAQKYSGEAQPLEYGGVIYTITGADDVFATDAKTGATKWIYRAQLNPKLTTVCCGWMSRGVALGGGKVYVAQLDGALVALDEKTGKTIWSTHVAAWQTGHTITSAPLYYDGLVYTGVSGGEYEIRGSLIAYAAKTGKKVWTFWTIPGPGQFGHNSWPANDAWKTGGAPVWQTPAVDPKLGLIYFSTGNASPDIDGSKRQGYDLFASSIVALDAKTGAYRWHFQEVHHDIWDDDAPSPVVLFDIKLHGRDVHGLGEPGKTGWLYLLNRETGKPLYGIPEKPVPQSALEHTSPTQPIPTTGSFVPHTVSAAGLKAVRAVAAGTLSEGNKPPKIVPGPFFTPPSHSGTVYAVSPANFGGADWPPSSYNPKTQMFYICGQESAVAYLTNEGSGPYKTGAQAFGSGGAPGGADSPGVLVAVDAGSGHIAWQDHWPDSCYSGTVTTAGDLVFVGRNDGQIEAFDAANGKLRWSFQTGAGANTTASVFSLNGKEVVAYYAAGNALAGTAHGDNLWLFGLDGTLAPVAPGKKASAIQHAGVGGVASSRIQVQGGEFFFKLSSHTGKLGKVTFVFKNAGQLAHNFAITGKSTPTIPPGHTATLTVTFTKPGNYSFFCTIPGHAQAGMRGVLTVK
jgi:quinohemoprotein ethanol dehydrogenase